MTPRIVPTTIKLAYSDGNDEPERGVFRRHPVDPEFVSELVVAIRGEMDPARVRWDSLGLGPPQVHLAGSARALEALGVHLIALARQDTAQLEPSSSIDEVCNADGGSMRLIVRRLPQV